MTTRHSHLHSSNHNRKALWLLSFLVVVLFLRDVVVHQAPSLPQQRRLRWDDGILNIQGIGNGAHIAPHTTASPPIQPSNPPYSSFPLRILFAVISYDTANVNYVNRLIHTISTDVCSANNNQQTVTMVIYSTVIWPSDILQRWHNEASSAQVLQNNCNFQIEVRLKNPAWKTELVQFHRQELFYNSSYLQNYDLMIYTEDDHDIRANHIEAWWKETRELKELLSPARFLDYSIGFLRYETTKDDIDISFEHNLDTSSVENFRQRHVVDIPELHGTSRMYFNGAGSSHQGFFFATPFQLKGWQHRPPNCQFHNNTMLYHREFTSSLHLYSEKGCNVTQLIPFRQYQNYFVHHRSNTQHLVLWKYLPKHDKVTNTPIQELASMLSKVMLGEQNHQRMGQNNNTTPLPQMQTQWQRRQRQRHVQMFNAEHDRPFQVNLSEFQQHPFE